jgi:predicted pyridoxine 5'-phosphate oxidase superfamily flavin-nucleotide-binding protein
MTTPVSDVAFSPAVKAVQERMGSRRGYASMEARGSWSDTITPDLASFIAERDSFYLGTASATGQPYIQHRGGPPGFLKVLDDRTLGFADYSGNRQYISVGNLSENDRAFIFLMDYPNRRRVKIWGRAKVVDDDDDLLQRLAANEAGARVERAFLFHIDAWDVNCPNHITPRFTAGQLEPLVEQLRARIRQLEAELATLPGENAA